MKTDEIYKIKHDKLTAQRTKLMQKVILLVDQVDKIDAEIESLETAEVERAGIALIKQVVGQTKGNTVIPEQPNLN